jgi:Domain of unknown function (DUF4397)
MRYRGLTLLAVLPFAMMGACSDSNSPDDTATVRFANATSSNIDVANAGVVSAGNVAFGGSSTCMLVRTKEDNLAFRLAGTATAITGFNQSFTSGGNFTVVAYPTGASTSFASISNGSFTPSSGQSGLRVFNAVSGSGNIVAMNGASALGSGTGVAFGSAGAFTSVPSGAQVITFNTGAGTSIIASTGSINFTAGQNYTLVVAPPSSGSTSLRTFLVGSC